MIASILKTVYTVSDGENSTAEWQGNNFHLTSPGYIPPSSLLHRTVTLAFNQKDEWQRPIRLQTWPYRLTEKSKLSFLWLTSAGQAPALLHATFYDKRQQRTPQESASHAETHEFTEVIILLTLRGFFFCLFSVPAVQLHMFHCPSSTLESQPGDAPTLRDVYWTALVNTFFHLSLAANLFASTPLPTAEKLSSSSGFLQVSDQKPQGAMMSRRDSAGDH